MRVLITGGAGFVGARLARTLLRRERLDGRRIEQIVLADQAAAPADLLADRRVQGRVGKLLEHASMLRDEAFDGVFHLASAVSGECEIDFDLGMTSNLDSTRALLDALRHRQGRSGGTAAPAAKFVFSSSIAVFGPDPAYPFPALVGDDTLPTPQTSYGAQKHICEHLIADYTRKGYLDGRAARLVTVTVRPGRPNGAASSFFSGIIREPLAGEEALLPVDPSVAHPVASPQSMVDGLVAVYEASREAFVGRSALNMPGLNVTVQQMLDALAKVAGPRVRALVKPARDERIAGIVANWPRGVTARRATALGIAAEASFEDIVRQYIADNEGHPTALKGLKELA
ncbi:MAG: NAD-dependent epimerase/dehydratase family protein [Rubrivivax sp.]|nr:NAD-dependent epimerase/dehydratase family protein [Rubrivivax sp.]